MGNVWSSYAVRMENAGATKRGSTYRTEVRNIYRRLPDSLSYHTVTIFDPEHGYNITEEDALSHAITQNVAIINSDNLNEKTIISMPGEDLVLGSLVDWMGEKWLMIEKDANNTLYVRGKLLQCNHLLKWIDSDNNIIEQWCEVEDGTKYLTGELEDRHFIVTRGDMRLSMTIARNSLTAKFTRPCRFIIDDKDSAIPIAYGLTKPLKVGGVYNNSGVYKFVLQEVQSTADDNMELQIPDYYKHFPRNSGSDDSQGSGDGSGNEQSSGRRIWL